MKHMRTMIFFPYLPCCFLSISLIFSFYINKIICFALFSNKKFNFINFHFYYPFILDKFGFMDYNNCDVWAVEVTHIIFECYQSVDFKRSTD